MGLATYNVLFVCTGNTCRSPFGEAALSAFLKGNGMSHIHVSSAGIYANKGQRASLLALEIAKKYQLNLESHRSRQLTAAHVDQADLILTMTWAHIQTLTRAYPEAGEKIFLMSHWYDGKEIVDPFSGDLQTYADVFEKMMACIPSIANYIKSLLASHF